MKYVDCFKYLASRRTDELVVTSAGNSGQAWWTTTRDSDKTFYLDASMSLSTLFASGMACALPKLKFWAFMGDGAFCMNPGMLMVERQLKLPNMVHLLVSNRAYGATSNASLPNGMENDYGAIARSFGIERVFVFDSMDGLNVISTRQWGATLMPTPSWCLRSSRFPIRNSAWSSRPSTGRN